MNRDIPSLLTNIRTEAVTLEAKAVDLTQSIQNFLNAASLLSAVAQHERDTAVAAVVALQERVKQLELELESAKTCARASDKFRQEAMAENCELSLGLDNAKLLLRDFLEARVTDADPSAAEIRDMLMKIANENARLKRSLEKIERQAIEQSETVQRDWASPFEVVGMKKRIAELEDGYAWKHENYVTAVNERDQSRAKILELESAAAWVPVAQRLPSRKDAYTKEYNVIFRKIQEGNLGPWSIERAIWDGCDFESRNWFYEVEIIMYREISLPENLP